MKGWRSFLRFLLYYSRLTLSELAETFREGFRIMLLRVPLFKFACSASVPLACTAFAAAQFINQGTPNQISTPNETSGYGFRTSQICLLF